MPSNRQRTRPGSPGGREQVLSQLQERLGYRFANVALLERALTHPSVSVDRAHEGGHYERLEFLGDRVLGLVVAESLFAKFPPEAEGRLARRLAKRVGTEPFATVAEYLGLGVRRGAGE